MYFFLWQIITITAFTCFKASMAPKALQQSISESNRKYRKYTAIRSLVYALEICIIVWGFEAFQFYVDLVQDSSLWVWQVIAFCLYLQNFYYLFVFIFAFPCWLSQNCNREEAAVEAVV